MSVFASDLTTSKEKRNHNCYQSAEPHLYTMKRKEPSPLHKLSEDEFVTSDGATGVYTSAISSSSLSGNDPADIAAQEYQTMENLISIFNFSPDLAQKAIQAVGSDLMGCYNWILEQDLADDTGGPVIPKTNCPHVSSHVKVLPENLRIDLECGHYEEEDEEPFEGSDKHGKSIRDESEGEGRKCPSHENWICLECNATRCSRYVNGHCKTHWMKNKNCFHSNNSLGEDQIGEGFGHCIAVSIADLSVWCYECNAYIEHNDLTQIIERLRELKFGIEDTNDPGNASDQANRHNYFWDGGIHSVGSSDQSHEDEIDDDSTDQICGDSEINCTERHSDLPRSLKDLADYILSEKCKSVAILAGAGMSRASGIPDFRSSGGMYETLRPELLTATEEQREAMRKNPTVVFGKPLFIENSLPCLELKRPFILGTRESKWKATLCHRFIELLHKKTGKLRRLYTQNIDSLEGQCTDLPVNKVIAVHGSMNKVSCEFCQTPMDFNTFCDKVRHNIKDITQKDIDAPRTSTPIVCEFCGLAGVKPDIVLFQSPLPQEFFTSVMCDAPSVDLLFVVGTSLHVFPACELVRLVPQTALRVIVNTEPVGENLGIKYGDDALRDYYAQGQCEEVFLNLMHELGWTQDLKQYIHDLPDRSSALVKARLRDI